MSKKDCDKFERANAIRLCYWDDQAKDVTLLLQVDKDLLKWYKTLIFKEKIETAKECTLSIMTLNW